MPSLNRLPPRATLVPFPSHETAATLEAPIFPYALVLVPETEVPDLPSLDDAGRQGLALLLVDVLEGLDCLFDTQTPYMLWIHQRPFDGGDWPAARLHVEVVCPWRAAGMPRYVAAGELGSGVYFNPVTPEEAARSLRRALRGRLSAG